MVYFLFDDHPVDIENMIVNDRIAKKVIILNFMFVSEESFGTAIQAVVYIISPTAGLRIKISLFVFFIFIHSFESNFVASLNG